MNNKIKQLVSLEAWYTADWRKMIESLLRHGNDATDGHCYYVKRCAKINLLFFLKKKKDRKSCLQQLQCTA